MKSSRDAEPPLGVTELVCTELDRWTERIVSNSKRTAKKRHSLLEKRSEVLLVRTVETIDDVVQHMVRPAYGKGKEGEKTRES